MKNAMTYKNYKAHIESDAQDHIFFGHLAGIRDVVTYAKLGDEPGNETAE